jgi:AraC-like DNA-binding protein
MSTAVREMLFSDSDEAAAAIRSTEIEFALLGPTRSEWHVGEAPLDETSLWWGKLGASSSALGTMRADTSWLVMAAGDADQWTVNRLPMGEREMGYLPAGVEYGCSYPIPGGWYALALPRDWLQEQAAMLLPEGFDPGKGVAMIDLGLGAGRARRAFATVARFATQHGERLENPYTRALLQGALVTELLGAVVPGEEEPVRNDQRLFSRVLEYLHAHRLEPVQQVDLCRHLATNRRALQRLFPQAFGTTPGKFLRIRRMHLARRALVSGEYSSVTEVAVQYGFFDLGRFASSYRALFRESPSHTLKAVQEGRTRGIVLP